MSFLWGATPGQTEFDTTLATLTSDTLPSSTPPDLLGSLQLADLIRSSAVPPLAATRSLLRRLKHDNPNVQLLSLAVLDICIKNGGTPFLTSVGSKECATELEQLGRTASNRDVKEKVLSKVQDWATAFQGKDSLKGTELVKSYEKMKSDGLQFPARDPTATAAMVDSLSAPEWTDSPYCTRCRTEFSTFNRKHHCRNCGDVFDQACSSQTSTLPHYGVTEPVRVCDGCSKKLKEGKGASVALGRSSSLSSKSASRPDLPERSSTVSYGKSHSHKSHNSTSALVGSKKSRSKEDDDLERAIAASLLDVNGSATAGPAFELRNPAAKSGYNPSYSTSAPASSSPLLNQAAAEDEDPDLAAAIAASLRDIAPAPSAPNYDSSAPAATYASLYGSTSPSASVAHPTSSTTTRYAPLPSYDLTPTESSSLSSFSNLLSQPGQHHLGSRERELYEQARAAAPRLERGLEDAERRKEILLEMNQKLGEATRLYQGLLEEGARAGSRSSYSNYQQPQAQQAYYPAPQPPTSYAPTAQPSSHYIPTPTSYSLGQPLPSSTYPTPIQTQSHAPISTAPIPPQPQHAPQQQPAGYYKPSQFPSVPHNALPTPVTSFPTVPQETPWEEEQQRREKEVEVGELIEL